MDHLWSPWRLAYITGARHSTDCVFCTALTDSDAAPLILFRGASCFIILNLFPYNNGHLGINLGKAAGAGILDHVHMHIVPRWSGDTNFMTVVGQTRVLPEELPVSADRLRPIFERLALDTPR